MNVKSESFHHSISKARPKLNYPILNFRTLWNDLVEYYDSEALIITLEVDNYNSGENLKRAKVWESNFI